MNGLGLIVLVERIVGKLSMVNRLEDLKLLLRTSCCSTCCQSSVPDLILGIQV